MIVSKFFPNGADVIIDAVGISTLFEKSLEIAAPASRIAVISFDSKAISVIPAEITRKELTIVGSRMNQGQFPQVLDLFKHKKLPHASKMISKIYPLGSIGQAFEYINKNSSTIIKVLIEI